MAKKKKSLSRVCRLPRFFKCEPSHTDHYVTPDSMHQWSRFDTMSSLVALLKIDVSKLLYKTMRNGYETFIYNKKTGKEDHFVCPPGGKKIEFEDDMGKQFDVWEKKRIGYPVRGRVMLKFKNELIYPQLREKYSDIPGVIFKLAVEQVCASFLSYENRVNGWCDEFRRAIVGLRFTREKVLEQMNGETSESKMKYLWGLLDSSYKEYRRVYRSQPSPPLYQFRNMSAKMIFEERPHLRRAMFSVDYTSFSGRASKAKIEPWAILHPIRLLKSLWQEPDAQFELPQRLKEKIENEENEVTMINFVPKYNPKHDSWDYDVVFVHNQPVEMITRPSVFIAPRVLALDIGMKNFIAGATNCGLIPFIVKGTALLELFQYIEKRRKKARKDASRDKEYRQAVTAWDKKNKKFKDMNDILYMADRFLLEPGKKPAESVKGSTRKPRPPYTKVLQQIKERQKNFAEDYVNKVVRFVVNLCVAGGIEIVCVGKIDFWKQQIMKLQALKYYKGQRKSWRGSRQLFMMFPFKVFVKKLEEQLAVKGILFCTVKEDYTSQASFVDGDEIPFMKRGKNDHEFSGKRSRGLYATSTGMVINADINGAYNQLVRFLEQIKQPWIVPREKAILRPFVIRLPEPHKGKRNIGGRHVREKQVGENGVNQQDAYQCQCNTLCGEWAMSMNRWMSEKWEYAKQFTESEIYEKAKKEYRKQLKEPGKRVPRARQFFSVKVDGFVRNAFGSRKAWMALKREELYRGLVGYRYLLKDKKDREKKEAADNGIDF